MTVEPMKPVAWMVTHSQDKRPISVAYCIGGVYPDPQARAEWSAKYYGGTCTPLYSTPPADIMGAVDECEREVMRLQNDMADDRLYKPAFAALRAAVMGET